MRYHVQDSTNEVYRSTTEPISRTDNDGDWTDEALEEERQSTEDNDGTTAEPEAEIDGAAGLRVAQNNDSVEDWQDIFQSSKMGLLERVRYFVEVEGVDVNGLDYWNAPPLYYACLCGHEALVKYLLEQGAECETDTYIGERCQYAALTPDIKNLLRSYNVTVAYRDPYAEFFRVCLESAEDKTKDVRFIFRSGEAVSAHRVILGSRSTYFRRLLGGKWRDQEIVRVSKSSLSFQAFSSLCKMVELEEQILVEQGSLKNHVSRLIFEPRGEKDRMREDYYHLFYGGCSATVRNRLRCPEPPRDGKEGKVAFSLPYDLHIEAGGQLFAVHRVFIHRSDYFKAMLSGSFAEGSAGSASDPIRINDIDPMVFAATLEFIYTNRVQRIDPELVIEVIYAADRFLLEGLKSYAVTVAAHWVDGTNVIEIYEISRALGLVRLEEHCTDVLAMNLEELLQLEGFKRLIQESAMSIKNKQEVDSIPLVDEIREALDRFYGGVEVEEGEREEDWTERQKSKQHLLAMLDGLVTSLGHEA